MGVVVQNKVSPFHRNTSIS